MSILNNSLYRPILEAIRSSRNGIVYGGKLRFSHALVINLLYQSGPLKPRLKQVIKATKNHAEVLAGFAVIYKIACKILANDAALGSKNSGLVKFLAGGLSGWVVYSQNFNYFHPGITHQITLYCFSRVMIALCKIILDTFLNCYQPKLYQLNGESIIYKDLSVSQQKKLKLTIYNKSWKYLAVFTWALVMFIYDYQPQYLQSSLRHSMAYIYDVETESWGSWREFFGI